VAQLRGTRTRFDLWQYGAGAQDAGASSVPATSLASRCPSSLSGLRVALKGVRQHLLDVLWQVEQLDETLELRLSASVNADPGAGAMVAGSTRDEGLRGTPRGSVSRDWNSVRHGRVCGCNKQKQWMTYACCVSVDICECVGVVMFQDSEHPSAVLLDPVFDAPDVRG